MTNGNVICSRIVLTSMRVNSVAPPISWTMRFQAHSSQDTKIFIAGLQLPDPDDRHVLAAAIRCNAT